MSTRHHRRRSYLDMEREANPRGLDDGLEAEDVRVSAADRQSAAKMSNTLVSATLEEADKGGAPSKLMLALYVSVVLIFSSFLYIRPYLWVSLSTPYKELRDPFRNAYWLCLYFSRFHVRPHACR